MFSKGGEKQFASHRTKAEEHYAKIFLHLMGLCKVRSFGQGAAGNNKILRNY
jgi:hypothetical protein